MRNKVVCSPVVRGRVIGTFKETTDLREVFEECAVSCVDGCGDFLVNDDDSLVAYLVTDTNEGWVQFVHLFVVSGSEYTEYIFLVRDVAGVCFGVTDNSLVIDYADLEEKVVASVKDGVLSYEDFGTLVQDMGFAGVSYVYPESSASWEYPLSKSLGDGCSLIGYVDDSDRDEEEYMANQWASHEDAGDEYKGAEIYDSIRCEETGKCIYFSGLANGMDFVSGSKEGVVLVKGGLKYEISFPKNVEGKRDLMHEVTVSVLEG